MSNTKAIEQYQCPGCVHGSSLRCGQFKPADAGVGCGSHSPATYVVPGVGKIFLGMPKGFNRMGSLQNVMSLYIYEDLNELHGIKPEVEVASVKDAPTWYTKFNVPVWKHRTAEGPVYVKGMHPRVNQNFLQVILSPEGFETIDCLEISKEEIAEMD
jgi:hypothetical protein